MPGSDFDSQKYAVGGCLVEAMQPDICLQRVWLAWAQRFNGRSMTEEERQALMECISEGVQDFFDCYDWDKKFIEHFGEQ